MTQVSYVLGNRQMFPGVTARLTWKDTKSNKGVLVWARDMKTGEYVRVYEYGPDFWAHGNFETVEAARKMASDAFRHINRADAP